MLPTIKASATAAACLPTTVHPEGHSGWMPLIVKMRIKGMISMSPDSCVFPYLRYLFL